MRNIWYKENLSFGCISIHSPVCLCLFSSSRPLIRKNLLLRAAPSHTQLRTLKPMLSNTLVASHITGNNWFPVKPEDAWLPTLHSRLLNIPRTINSFTYCYVYTFMFTPNFYLSIPYCCLPHSHCIETPAFLHWCHPSL